MNDFRRVSKLVAFNQSSQLLEKWWLNVVILEKGLETHLTSLKARLNWTDNSISIWKHSQLLPYQKMEKNWSFLEVYNVPA